MRKNSVRRLVIMILIAVVCTGVLLIANIIDFSLEPSAYNYYIENGPSESGMPNLVTAIYLRYRVFDTLFETLLLAMSVSAIVYFAAAWEKGKEDHEDE